MPRPRLVIVGYTAQLVDRLRESTGRVDTPTTIVLNLVTADLVAEVQAAGLAHVTLDAFEPQIDDWLLLGVLRPATKRTVAADFERKLPGYLERFRPAVHAFTSVSPTATFGPGCFVEAGVVLAPHAVMERFVSINRNSSIGHHTSVGAWSMINPGVNIAGNCRIGEAVTVGIGCTVFDGVQIGAGSVIGGGSVVTRDVPPGVLAFGNPCRIVREL